jgi:hypothetical protein
MDGEDGSRNATTYLNMNAWCVRLRFEYLADGLPKNWDSKIMFGKNMGPGIYVRTSQSALEFSPPALGCGNRNFWQAVKAATGRIERWYCLWLSQCRRGIYSCLCDKMGNEWQRIGLVYKGKSIHIKDCKKFNSLDWPKTWRTEILLSWYWGIMVRG